MSISKVAELGIAVGWDAGVSEGVAVDDGVETTVGGGAVAAVGDGVTATVRVAVGEFATEVDSGVCAVGVDVAVLVGAVGVGVAVPVGAVGVETFSLFPGKSDIDCATARLFDL